jgi:16S rRNA (cytosine967-C5)-methyltransferase
LSDKKPLPDIDQPLPPGIPTASLSHRDQMMARAIARITLRHLGELDAVLRHTYKKGLPSRSGNLRYILLNAVAQILFMEIGDHAAVDLAVRLTGQDRRARHHKGLVNAGLRRISEAGKEIIDGLDAPVLNTPKWMFEIWRKQWGADIAREISAAHLNEAALDLTPKDDGRAIAELTGGILLSTGSIRLGDHGKVDTIPGYEDGIWWVQDAAAALPVKLLGDFKGKHVAELCAAPGGKSLQLAAGGARVTAIDISESRLKRLRENLSRTGLDADILVMDALTWHPAEPPDMILIDAPCNATGTIRRHPDIPRTRNPARADQFVDLQERLLDHSAKIVAPGGTIVFCTCSLDPREGEQQISAFLARNSDFQAVPVLADDIGGMDSAITEDGYLRTLPYMTPPTRDNELATGGMDGFFAARLVKTSI